MKRQHGVAVLLDALDTATDHYRVCTSVDGWARRPQSEAFYLIAEDELEEDGRTALDTAGEIIPPARAEEDVETCLDVQVLRTIPQVVRNNDMPPAAAS